VRILKFRGLKKLEQMLPYETHAVSDTGSPAPSPGYSTPCSEYPGAGRAHMGGQSSSI